MGASAGAVCQSTYTQRVHVAAQLPQCGGLVNLVLEEVSV